MQFKFHAYLNLSLLFFSHRRKPTNTRRWARPHNETFRYSNSALPISALTGTSRSVLGCWRGASSQHLNVPRVLLGSECFLMPKWDVKDSRTTNSECQPQAFCECYPVLRPPSTAMPLSSFEFTCGCTLPLDFTRMLWTTRAIWFRNIDHFKILRRDSDNDRHNQKGSHLDLEWCRCVYDYLIKVHKCLLWVKLLNKFIIAKYVMNIYYLKSELHNLDFNAVQLNSLWER